MDRKKQYWRQISREKIIKEWHRNRKKIHIAAAIKNKKKRILKLRLGGRMTMNPRSIKKGIRGSITIFTSRTTFHKFLCRMACLIGFLVRSVDG